jgi:MFS transporter, DHA2 family, methylenomycin A resistance protein
LPRSGLVALPASHLFRKHHTCPQSEAPGAAHAPTVTTSHPRASLALAMLGFAVVTLDVQIVNVALPSIGNDLGGGLAALQWVVTAYTLMFFALLMFGGTFGDRVGARRAYGLGMMLFVVASAACGLAPSMGLLVAARVLQGIGAALVTPTSLALLRENYTDATARARAIAYWALGGSAAAAAGPILGGVLTQWDWRVIFLINLPLGTAALLTLARVAESPRRDRPFDVTGQVTAVVALVTLTYAVIEGGHRGWATPVILAALGLAVLSFAVFLTSQAKGRHPMVRLELFTLPPVAISLVVGFIGMVGFYGVVFAQSLYFQQLRGATALETGLLFLPMTALVALLNPTAAKVAARFGPRVPIVGGQVLMALGLVGIAVAPADLPLWVVSLLMVPVGVGGSFTVPPLTSVLMDAVPAERAGTASGVLNTARQVGGSLGVAAIGAVIAAHTSFMPGLRISLLAVAVLVAAAAALSLTLRPSRAR